VDNPRGIAWKKETFLVASRYNVEPGWDAIWVTGEKFPKSL